MSPIAAEGSILALGWMLLPNPPLGVNLPPLLEVLELFVARRWLVGPQGRAVDLHHWRVELLAVGTLLDTVRRSRCLSGAVVVEPLPALQPVPTDDRAVVTRSCVCAYLGVVSHHRVFSDRRPRSDCRSGPHYRVVRDRRASSDDCLAFEFTSSPITAPVSIAAFCIRLSSRS